MIILSTIGSCFEKKIKINSVIEPYYMVDKEPTSKRLRNAAILVGLVGAASFIAAGIAAAAFFGTPFVAAAIAGTALAAFLFPTMIGGAAVAAISLIAFCLFLATRTWEMSLKGEGLKRLYTKPETIEYSQYLIVPR